MSLPKLPFRSIQRKPSEAFGAVRQTRSIILKQAEFTNGKGIRCEPSDGACVRI